MLHSLHPSPAVAMFMMARALERWDPAKHPRIPKGLPDGGQFLTLDERMQVAMHSGGDDPLKGFSRTQLMSAAKDRGIYRRKGITEPELRAALEKDIKGKPVDAKVAALAHALQHDQMPELPAKKSARKAAPKFEHVRIPGESTQDELARIRREEDAFYAANPTKDIKGIGDHVDSLASSGDIEGAKAAMKELNPTELRQVRDHVGLRGWPPSARTSEEKRDFIAASLRTLSAGGAAAPNRDETPKMWGGGDPEVKAFLGRLDTMRGSRDSVQPELERKLAALTPQERRGVGDALKVKSDDPGVLAKAIFDARGPEADAKTLPHLPPEQLAKMKVADLKAYAAERGFSLGQARTKPQILAAIERRGQAPGHRPVMEEPGAAAGITTSSTTRSLFGSGPLWGSHAHRAAELKAMPATTEGVERAKASLSGHSLADLKALRKEIGPTVTQTGTTKKQIIDDIVAGTVGFRARAAANAGGGHWENGQFVGGPEGHGIGSSIHGIEGSGGSGTFLDTPGRRSRKGNTTGKGTFLDEEGPTKARAAKPDPAKLKADFAEAVARPMPSDRERFKAKLGKLTGAQLADIAVAHGAKLPSGTKQNKVNALVENQVGFRLNSESIRHGVTNDPQLKAINAAMFDADTRGDRAEYARLHAERLAIQQGHANPRRGSGPKAAAPSLLPVTGARSMKPLKPNTWGAPKPDTMHYHPDTAIGRAIDAMGDEKHMDVGGEPLGNVLGEIATDTVLGRVSAQDQIGRLRDLHARLPDGPAKRHVGDVIANLEAPPMAAPKLPAATPLPLQELATELVQIPRVRRNPRALDKLTQTAADFEAGRTGSSRLVAAVRNIAGSYHESEEGSFDVRRAADKAANMLEEMSQHNRTSLYPPGRGGPSTPAALPFTHEQVAMRRQMNLLRIEMQSKPGERDRITAELARLEGLYKKLPGPKA